MLNLIKWCLRAPIILIYITIAGVLLRATSFLHVSIFLSKIPFKTGLIIRRIFYNYTLDSFGENVTINYGSIISYRNTNIGNNVWIGTNNIIGNVDMADNVITAQGCHLISGGKISPVFSTTQIPMNLQEAKSHKIIIESDVWIGAGSVIGVNVHRGTIVNAGSVVCAEFNDYAILEGNPATIKSNREIIKS